MSTVGSLMPGTGAPPTDGHLAVVQPQPQVRPDVDVMSTDVGIAVPDFDAHDGSTHVTHPSNGQVNALVATSPVGVPIRFAGPRPARPGAVVIVFAVRSGVRTRRAPSTDHHQRIGVAATSPAPSTVVRTTFYRVLTTDEAESPDAPPRPAGRRTRKQKAAPR